MSPKLPICGDRSDNYQETGIICELPPGHGDIHGAYIWEGWVHDEPSEPASDTCCERPCQAEGINRDEN